MKRTLHLDSTFLCSVGIMDYSLLVGVHRNTRQHDRARLSRDLSEIMQAKSQSALSMGSATVKHTHILCRRL